MGVGSGKYRCGECGAHKATSSNKASARSARSVTKSTGCWLQRCSETATGRRADRRNPSGVTFCRFCSASARDWQFSAIASTNSSSAILLASVILVHGAFQTLGNPLVHSRNGSIQCSLQEFLITLGEIL